MTDTTRPWLPGEAAADADKRHAPATLRNRDAIVAILETVLPETGLIVEIASGSGEHAVHFAKAFPNLCWLPSDPDPAALRSIAAWADEAALDNLAAPLLIDAADPNGWTVGNIGAILCINMTHISPWIATVGLFDNGAKLLQPGAPLIIYGPYMRAGHAPAPSNLAFDESLKARNGSWGIRSLEDVSALAESSGFTLEAVHEMPANNLTIIYRRCPSSGDEGPS